MQPGHSDSAQPGPEKDELPETQGTAESPAKVWLTPGRFAVFLGLLICATFPDVLLLGRTFIARDFGLFGYPLAHFYRESFWHGELPHWNPFSHCGLPFLAQWNTLTLYPASLIYLVLPLEWSLSFFCVAHLFWGGLGMFFLARHLSRHMLAAAVAGIAFSFNGVFLNAMMWPNNAAAFGWLPWVLWLAPLACQNGGRTVVWATIAAAMQMLAGAPEAIFLTWVILSVMLLGDCFHCHELRLKIVWRFFGMVALVFLVCAAQLLPFLELLFRSQRDSTFGSSLEYSMPPWGWANFLVPLFGCTRTTSGLYLQEGQFWTASYYAGIGTVLLVAVALRRVQSWRVRLLAGLVLLGIVFALGKSGFLYPALLSRFPAIGFMRFPVKFVILVMALTPVLAAFGFAALANKLRETARFEWCCTAVILLLVAGIAVFSWKSPNEMQPAVWQNAVSRVSFMILIFLLILAFVNSRAGRQALFGCLLLVVFWLDLVTQIPNQNPSVPTSVYSPRQTQAQRTWTPEPRLGKARAMISPTSLQTLAFHSLPDLADTYLLQRLGLLANCNLLDEVPQVHGFFSLQPAEANNLTAIPYRYPDTNFTALLDLMGVAQITAPGKVFGWNGRFSAMPLVTAGQRPIFAEDGTVLGAFFQTNVDFRQVVFLPSQATNVVQATKTVSAQVLHAEFGRQRVSARIASPASTMVVIAQSYYPAWKAYLDGQPVKLWRADYAFQAVQMPAGEHTIVLEYKDVMFRVGLVLTVLGLGLCVIVWVVGGAGSGPLQADQTSSRKPLRPA